MLGFPQRRRRTKRQVRWYENFWKAPKGLQRFFEHGHHAGIQPAHAKKIHMRLAALDTATCIEDMDLPGLRLHTLLGKTKLWAIDVNKNWRIVFEFINGNAYIVNYEDYH